MGNGGSKHAVRRVAESMPKHNYVFLTDVKKYYASIDHDVLTEQLCGYIDDDIVLDLLCQYMKRTLYQDGLYRDVSRGISLGCSLSPLIGALYLKPVDDLFKDSELFYARFMDDWVILSPSRWKLRRAVAEVNRVLDALKVKQHPDKTFVGRTCRGFDFLGYQFDGHCCGLNVSARAIANRDERIHRLYEQGADEDRIGDYVRRWWSWAKGGLQPITRLVPQLDLIPFTLPGGVAAVAGPQPAESAWR